MPPGPPVQYTGLSDRFVVLYGRPWRSPWFPRVFSDDELPVFSDDELPVFTEEFAIDAHFAAAAQVAYHVPVQGGLVEAAGLWDATAQGQVDSAAYFFVEEGIFDRAIDVFVVAK